MQQVKTLSELYHLLKHDGVQLQFFHFRLPETKTGLFVDSPNTSTVGTAQQWMAIKAPWVGLVNPAFRRMAYQMPNIDPNIKSEPPLNVYTRQYQIDGTPCLQNHHVPYYARQQQQLNQQQQPDQQQQPHQGQNNRLFLVY